VASLDVHQLRVLRELRDRGSVTAVAAALGVSPSAVSQQIAVLQRRFPVPLTRREGRQLVLTGAGQRLAAAAVDVAVALAHAEAEVMSYLDEPSGVVSVAAFHSAGIAWFAALADDTQRDTPTVTLQDQDVSVSRSVQLVGDFDLVIGQRADNGPAWPLDRVSVVALMHEPLDVAMSVHHPLAAQESVTAADVRDVDWVAVHEDYPLACLIDAVSAAAGRPARVRHRINDFSVAVRVVAAGRMVALVPRHIGIPALHDGTVLRPLVDVQAGRHIEILARPENLRRRSVRTIIHRLQGLAGEIAGT
jgi:DNA-binding transcriptional LysR family regulator